MDFQISLIVSASHWNTCFCPWNTCTSSVFWYFYHCSSLFQEKQPCVSQEKQVTGSCAWSMWWVLFSCDSHIIILWLCLLGTDFEVCWYILWIPQHDCMPSGHPHIHILNIHPKKSKCFLQTSLLMSAPTWRSILKLVSTEFPFETLRFCCEHTNYTTFIPFVMLNMVSLFWLVFVLWWKCL